MPGPSTDEDQGYTYSEITTGSGSKVVLEYVYSFYRGNDSRISFYLKIPVFSTRSSDIQGPMYEGNIG